jgi:hypothetical protein
MVNSRQIFCFLLCLTSLLVAALAQARDGECLAGPAYAKFGLTLEPGWREEAAGPFFYEQAIRGQTQWALPPFFCRTSTPLVDWEEWDLLYPVIDYRRFGNEYRLQFMQLLSFSGARTQEKNSVRHTTFFPIYFRQRSSETNVNYTAFVPFYGHLVNRLFRDDIKFVMFPVYSETRKKDVVTDNYFYPVFDRRRGNGLTGWQVWPLFGRDRKIPTLRTNSMKEVITVGGYDNFFAMWPIYFKSRAGVGTTNPASSLTVVPFYSKTRSPSRDATSYGFPFGYNAVVDREQGYVEHDFLWPFFVRAHGSKTVTRYFPIYSRAEHKGLESLSYGFLLYKFNRLEGPTVFRRRTRILYFLYSDTVERNTQTRQFKRRVDFWPFYTYDRKMDGSRRLQVLGVVEPVFPNNRAITREYSPLLALWRAEKNPHTRATSQSLLWNLYRRETVRQVRKASLLFGLIQYQCTADGGHWRVCYVNLGRKPAQAKAAKS